MMTEAFVAAGLEGGEEDGSLVGVVRSGRHAGTAADRGADVKRRGGSVAASDVVQRWMGLILANPAPVRRAFPVAEFTQPPRTQASAETMQVITLGSSPGSGVGALPLPCGWRLGCSRRSARVLPTTASPEGDGRVRSLCSGGRLCDLHDASLEFHRDERVVLENMRECDRCATTLLVAFLAVPIVVPLARSGDDPFGQHLLWVHRLGMEPVCPGGVESSPTERADTGSEVLYIRSHHRCCRGGSRRDATSSHQPEDGYDEVNIERDGTFARGTVATQYRNQVSAKSSGRISLKRVRILSVADSTVVARKCPHSPLCR